MFEPNNNEGKSIPFLEYQQGRFIYSLDKNISNDINNLIQTNNYNTFHRLPNNPSDINRFDMRFPFPYNMYGYNPVLIILRRRTMK